MASALPFVATTHLISILLLLTPSLSNLDCRHFVSMDRLYIPLGVCAQHRYIEPETNRSHHGSHMYSCDDDRVVMYYWEDSLQCDGSMEFESNHIHTQEMQCSGKDC